MTVLALQQLIETVIAPKDCAWRKDNIGFLVGDSTTEVTRALVALDISLDVIAEAHTWGAQVILSHHPVIFNPSYTITDQSATGRRVRALMQHDISAICLHTNYDGAAGGINDELAQRLGLNDIQVLINSDGNYGRYGKVPEQSAGEYALKVRDRLQVTGMRYWDAGRPVSNVCVGSGASGGLLELVLAAGCDTLVTGDLRHNHFCDARDMGLNLIDAGHFATEDFMCQLLIDQLRIHAPNLMAKQAVSDCAPYVVPEN